MERLLAVGIGGALGSCGRYLLGGWVQRWCGAGFPAGTLVVNLLGSYLVAVVMQVGLETQLLSPALRLALVVGVMGGFTTYSAFSYETLGMLQKGSTVLALANVAATVLGCLASCWLGAVTARALLTPLLTHR